VLLLLVVVGPYQAVASAAQQEATVEVMHQQQLLQEFSMLGMQPLDPACPKGQASQQA
jgi:hypothetical protein